MSCETCPSHERFLRQHLPGLSTQLNILVPTALIEESMLPGKESNKSVAAVFAILSVVDNNSTDGRSLQQLCVYDRNTDKWKTAAARSVTSDECPICLEPYSQESPREGPLSYPWPTRCTHWACKLCWEKAAAHGNTRCPVCREDLTLMLASMLPDSSPARTLRASDRTLEYMLTAGGWSTQGLDRPVRRGAGGNTFSVKDVLERACKEPAPDWHSLELADLIVAADTKYELVADGTFGCMAVAPGHAILRALSSLPDERLKAPVHSEDESFTSWSILGSLIVLEGMYSTLWRGDDLVQRVVLPPNNIVVGEWRRRRYHIRSFGDSSEEEDSDTEESEGHMPPPPIT